MRIPCGMRIYVWKVAYIEKEEPISWGQISDNIKGKNKIFQKNWGETKYCMAFFPLK